MDKSREKELNELNEEFENELKHLNNEIFKTLFLIDLLVFRTITKTLKIINKGEENERS